MNDSIQLLLVDDEERFVTTLAGRLRLRGFDVLTANSGEEAVEIARRRPFDVALVDLKMAGMNGEELLTVLKHEHPLLEVIILTGHGSIDSAVRCTREGSYTYLPKPCHTDYLVEVLNDAWRQRLARRAQLDQEETERLVEGARSESPQGLLRRIRRLQRQLDG